MNGLPPHNAQVICGHKNIDTTIGYKAVPAETIEAHRAFIAHRRTSRPGEEYWIPTEKEWDAFLAHFEKRKLSIGTCARAFGSLCNHEHACVRCSLLRPDPAQRAQLADIPDNLIARIDGAKRKGWRGEVDGLQVSLAGAEEELASMRELATKHSTTNLGMHDFHPFVARSASGDDIHRRRQINQCLMIPAGSAGPVQVSSGTLDR